MRFFGHHIALPVALLVFCDVCLFLFGLLLVTWLYPIFARVPFNQALFTAPLVGALATINLICLVAAGLFKRDAINIGGRLSRHSATATSLIVVAFAAFLVPYSWLHGHRFSNLYAVALAAACFQLVLSFFVRALLVNMFHVVGLKRRVLLVGDNHATAKIGAWFATHDPGYTDVIQYDSFQPERGTPFHRRSAAVLAELEAAPARALPELARDQCIDEIVVTTETRETNVWELLECRTRGINVIDLLSFWEREAGRIDLDAVEARWLVYSGGFRNSALRRFSQRTLDVLISVLGLSITSVLLPLIAFLIWVDSRGPIFYRQERIGKDGRPFQILKFRSMCKNAEPDNIPQWAQIKDARVTRVGSLLRMLRIDELPQLVNVLKGEMSVVGPRPERPAFVHTLDQQIPFYSVRHLVRPGITGWAQINHEYTASLEDAKLKLEYDLFYVKNQNLFLNLAIILQTLRIVLWRHGAR